MIYLVVLFLLLLLSVRYDINGKTRAREFWYGFMLVVFILVAGLRWRIGIDTPPYLYNFYHKIPTIDEFLRNNYSIGEDPFWILLNSIVKTMGGRFYVVQLIHASIVNVAIFKFIKKYSDYWFTCLFFYAITCYTTYNMEIMRGSLSIVICLYANDYILEKKWLKGYMLYFLALMFHAQTLIMFILPLFFFLRFNKFGVLAWIGAFLGGIVIMDILSDYMFLFEASDIIQGKVSAYSESDYGTQKGGLSKILFYIFPMLLYSIASFLLLKYFYSDNRLLKFEPLIAIGVIFMLIRMNIEIAYRYVDYYKIYFVLIFSECFIRMTRRTAFLYHRLTFVRAFALFVPLFLHLSLGYLYKNDYSLRYRPYSSVIEKYVYRERELMYKKLNASKAFYPNANKQEY